MNKRDVEIIHYLKKFRVLSRDQLGRLCFQENKNPQVVVNRVMKRLHLEGKVYTVMQPKDRCYLYMPNPTMIHPNSIKTKHFMAIADFYDRIGRPEKYIVEPNLGYEYRPDVYMEYKNEQIVVEIQLTHISTKKMQDKVDMWISGYGDKHFAKKMWIVADNLYKLNIPAGFDIQFHRWTKGV